MDVSHAECFSHDPQTNKLARSMIRQIEASEERADKDGSG